MDLGEVQLDGSDDDTVVGEVKEDNHVFRSDVGMPSVCFHCGRRREMHVLLSAEDAELEDGADEAQESGAEESDVGEARAGRDGRS